MFLLSRIHEAWIVTRDPHRSVAIGIGATARVITTAAAIMVVVFASFVVRMVLVPAVMTLLGRHAWWMPRWMEPVAPRLHLEEGATAAAADRAEGASRKAA
ncbi:MAG TPA: MMPL family transporter [Streptosporangiaceae bacterium]|nr:MMPL family transporter [Streptosporangiaceae bacterium]